MNAKKRWQNFISLIIVTIITYTERKLCFWLSDHHFLSYAKRGDRLMATIRCITTNLFQTKLTAYSGTISGSGLVGSNGQFLAVSFCHFHFTMPARTVPLLPHSWPFWWSSFLPLMRWLLFGGSGWTVLPNVATGTVTITFRARRRWHSFHWPYWLSNTQNTVCKIHTACYWSVYHSVHDNPYRQSFCVLR